MISKARVGHGREQREGSLAAVLMTDGGRAAWRGGFAHLRRLQGSRHGPKVVGFPAPRRAGSGYGARVVGPTCRCLDCDVFLNFHGPN
jgi:hypothetical protein